MTAALFGDKASFAVEVEFTGSDGEWRFGHLRFWIDNRAVGDFDDTVDLASSARWGRVFLSASSVRSLPDLDTASAEEVYHLLYGRFFERGGADPGDPFERDPFLLDDVGESALRDRSTVLVVRRGNGRDRLLIRDHETEALVEYELSPGICDRVIESYCAWVESLA